MHSYLLTPLAAGAVVFVLAAEREQSPAEARSPLVLASLAAVAAALPLACLVIPYVTHGKLWELAYGTMVVPPILVGSFGATINATLPVTGVYSIGIDPQQAYVGGITLTLNPA